MTPTLRGFKNNGHSLMMNPPRAGSAWRVVEGCETGVPPGKTQANAGACVHPSAGKTPPFSHSGNLSILPVLSFLSPTYDPHTVDPE
jgi:hypothetical protein